MSYSLFQLNDRAEIQDLIHRWARAVDRLDYDGMRECFHPDGTDSHGLYQGNVDGMIEWIRERHRGIPFSAHVVTNILVDFTGEDTAGVETYCYAVQHYPAGEGRHAELPGAASTRAGVSMDLMGFARYVDRVERREGRWKILQRMVIFDDRLVFERREGGIAMGPGFTVGRRDRSDYSYRVLPT